MPTPTLPFAHNTFHHPQTVSDDLLAKKSGQTAHTECDGRAAAGELAVHALTWDSLCINNFQVNNSTFHQNLFSLFIHQ